MEGLAAILINNNEPLAIERIELPKIHYGQVLVKILRSGICGSQLGEIRGDKGHDPYLPHLLGHEGTGIVLEAGDGVKHVKKDDRVVLHWRPGKGLESQPPTYQHKTLGAINAGWITTFNEYAVVSENRLTVIPSDFDLDTSVLFGCALTTAMGVINNNAAVKIGESVVVFGSGGVGLSIVQAAALVSAYPIVAIDLYDNKLTLAKKLGATHTINANCDDTQEKVKEIVGAAGADVVIDNTGNVKVIESCYQLTCATGRTILVGVPPANEKISIYSLPLHFTKTLTGSHGGESNPSRDIPNYIKLIKADKLTLTPLIDRSYPLQDINQAITDMQSGSIVGRCVINCT